MNQISMPSLQEKLHILVEGAKYDVSCSSSGSGRTAEKGSLGDCAKAGICHSFTPDGRCISLMKLLMTNYCCYDCQYCVNRASNDIPRARLTPREIAELVIDFYRRNFIEGLFLSSAVERSPDYTMERLIETLRLLRSEYKFRGYIHVKAIPGADPLLFETASKLADRMSVNIELPSESSLKLLAPQKSKVSIFSPMRQLSDIYLSEKAEGKREKALPAGQTTQMVIGASPDSDGQILRLSQGLYRNFGLKRVYYSAYVPVNSSSRLPALPPDLKREHRLYEADWLLRFYGFNAEELSPTNCNLPLDVDPKTDWALRNLSRFPVEINTADYETLLRVPGIGVRNAFRIREARKYGKLTFDSLKKMRVALTRARHFITADGQYHGLQQQPEIIRSALNGNALMLETKSGVFQQFSFLPSLTPINGEL